MTIKLYNSMSRNVEEFIPGDPLDVMMYACGPTVYDTPHLGNARPAVIFDVLFRLLGNTFGEDHISYARNYTDIDDKIMARAAELGEDITVLTGQMISRYKLVMNALGNRPPTYSPRATDSIVSITAMIVRLELEGHAYVSEGHVFFDVPSWPTHGKLAAHRQEDLESGHGREIKNMGLKRNPSDFVLWKPSTDDQPGWDSPWGRGRPGWHIECSAMINELFHEQTIDIHAGGADLRFPHHECEISQSEACTHKPLARYWMHNAMVTVNGKKMAKSEGNFITVDDVLARGIPGQAIRLALLSSHYRSPLDWTDELISVAKENITNWHIILDQIDAPAENNEYAAHVLDALRNDLNTPLAINRIFEILGSFADNPEAVAAGVRYAGGVLGFDLNHNDSFLRDGPDRAEVETLIAERAIARTAKNFAESDRIRDLLNSMGLVIEDGSLGAVRWRRG